MKESELERILSSEFRRATEVPPAVLARIARSLRTSLRPVSPLPPTWVLISQLLALNCILAVTGATLSGLDGMEAMSPKTRIAIFVMLAILGCATGRKLVNQFIPGRAHIESPHILTATIVGLFFGAFSLLLLDYRDPFITAGITCLATGLLYAIPAALISAWILRRGFAVSPVSAGLWLGVFSGITGVATLELRCPDFQTPHLPWHLLVVPVAGIVGALVRNWLVGRA